MYRTNIKHKRYEKDISHPRCLPHIGRGHTFRFRNSTRHNRRHHRNEGGFHRNNSARTDRARIGTSRNSRTAKQSKATQPEKRYRRQPRRPDSHHPDIYLPLHRGVLLVLLPFEKPTCQICTHRPDGHIGTNGLGRAATEAAPRG